MAIVSKGGGGGGGAGGDAAMDAGGGADEIRTNLPPRTGRMKPTRLLDDLAPALEELR